MRRKRRKKIKASIHLQKDSNLIQRISYLERYGKVIDEVCSIMDEHQNVIFKIYKVMILLICISYPHFL